MEHRVTASVRKDLREEGIEIAVETPDGKHEWVTFRRRPASVVSETQDDLYRVELEDGRIVVADSVDLDFHKK